MANIKSQIKRNRQNEQQRLRNKAVRSEIRTRAKKALEAAENGSTDTDELYRIAQKKIDVAVSKGVLHPNTAARRKARLARSLRAASS